MQNPHTSVSAGLLSCGVFSSQTATTQTMTTHASVTVPVSRKECFTQPHPCIRRLPFIGFRHDGAVAFVTVLHVSPHMHHAGSVRPLSSLCWRTIPTWKRQAPPPYSALQLPHPAEHSSPELCRPEESPLHLSSTRSRQNRSFARIILARNAVPLHLPTTWLLPR